MISTRPRGLAFGRADWVGVDGRLTGVGSSLSSFHCVLGLVPGREEESTFTFLPSCIMTMPNSYSPGLSCYYSLSPTEVQISQSPSQQEFTSNPLSCRRKLLLPALLSLQ